MKLSTLFLFAICMLPTSALTQVTHRLVLDAQPKKLEFLQTGDLLEIWANTHNSYCCTINGKATNGDQVAFLEIQNLPNATFQRRGDDTPATGTKAGRVCWIDTPTPATANNYWAFRRPVIANITNPFVATADAWCEQTTLSGNYNTSVSELNFLEITATNSQLSTTVNLVLLLTSSVTGQKREMPIQITMVNTEGNFKRQDIAIHDLLGNTADFGSIKLTHDGAPGQVKARVSQYDITSTNPLNFTLVGQEKLTRGSEN